MGTKKISMLNITFKLHNYQRKDGRYQLLIRLRSSQKEKVITTEVHIDKSKWDNSNKMVRSDHIAAEPINKLIKGYHDKIKKIKPLFELGEIDFEEAYLMLTSSGSLDSLESYREHFCKRESAQWHRNTQNSLNAFKYHTGLKHINFKDVTRENILKMKDSR